MLFCLCGMKNFFPYALNLWFRARRNPPSGCKILGRSRRLGLGEPWIVGKNTQGEWREPQEPRKYIPCNTIVYSAKCFHIMGTSGLQKGETTRTAGHFWRFETEGKKFPHLTESFWLLRMWRTFLEIRGVEMEVPSVVPTRVAGRSRSSEQEDKLRRLFFFVADPSVSSQLYFSPVTYGYGDKKIS